jgi:hypothetical protein
MLSDKAIHELETAWLPNITDAGLEYLARLLETASPYLIRRAWASNFVNHAPEFDIADAAIGCIATHAGWHHPATLCMHGNAGHTWLTTIAGVESERSAVLQEWDGDAPVEAELAYILRQEQRRRRAISGNSGRQPPRLHHGFVRISHGQGLNPALAEPGRRGSEWQAQPEPSRCCGGELDR